jgi:ligand-binding sensor domain-containing protein
MNVRRFILHPSSFILLGVSVAFAQMPYDIGDWTSYRDFRYARALDVGTRDLFVATSGGVLQYHLLRQQWYDPMVVGYGLSEGVEFDDPLLVLFDEPSGSLWLATRTQVLQFDVNMERWRRAARNLWQAGDRVVNLGVGGNYVYVETIPDALYSSLFTAGTPLPNDLWRDYVSRYEGSRTFGVFGPDLDPFDPEKIRWRGLRSREPIPRDELYGLAGSPPANFPVIILPSPWTWHADGVLLDPYIRAMPITDWLVDGYGSLWTTFWGGGVMRADLRSGVADFYSAGPAGNDVHSLLVGKDEIWIAGFNSGDRKGISRASSDLRRWRFWEMLDDIRIRSTDVNDIAAWAGRVYFATEEGLLAYQEKEGGLWSRFTVSENLQSDQIRALAAADSELWIGNSRGLCFMTLPSREIWRVENSGIELAGVTDLAVCGDTVYVATPQGLFKGDSRSRRFAFAPLDPGLLNAPVLELSVCGSEVWLATAEGIQVYDQAAGKSRSWLANVWLGQAEPSCILAADKFIWVGTRKNGFYRYRRDTGEWISYTTVDGLVDDHVQTIRRMGDDLLIGTPNGLTRFYWNRPERAR